MHRTALLSFGVAIAVSILAMGRVGHVEEPATESPRTATPHTAVSLQHKSRASLSSQDAIRALEIIELRDQLGGSLLEDSLLNDPDSPTTVNEEFLNALQGQLAEDRLPPVEEPRELPPRRIGTARLPGFSQVSNVADLAAVLRTAGRHLDTHASDLEDIGDYQRSDELRRLAKRIRQVAREFRNDDAPQTQELSY